MARAARAIRRPAPARGALARQEAARGDSWPARFLRFCRQKPLGGFGAVALAAMVVLALGAELFATHDPVAADAAHTLNAPTWQHFFGTDYLGRDMYSRIVHGTRISLAVGLISTVLG